MMIEIIEMLLEVDIKIELERQKGDRNKAISGSIFILFFMPPKMMIIIKEVEVTRLLAM